MNEKHIAVKIILDRWNALIARFDTILNSVTDDELQKEIAPNKNRGVYLLGHLIAIHDDMLPVLNFGDKLYPEINTIFKSPDRSVDEIPSAKELRTCWNTMNALLSEKFNNLQPEDWFQKHESVSVEEFRNEPHRNKLNILLTRTSHLSYHLGQFVWIK